MPVTTKTTSQNFSGTGSQTAFQFTIEYDSTKISDLKVEVGGVVQTETTHYSISGTTLTFVSAPAAGTNNIRIYRSTSLDSAGAVFAAGSSIRATDLNNNQDQFLFAAQELQNDQLQDTVGATPPSGPFNGQRWYNTTNGRTYVWYVDVDTSQWVEASPPFDASGDRSFTQTGTGAVARTWDSKLKDVVSVKDFGAVGDGTTDDTAAFVAMASALGYIVVSRGDFALTSTQNIDKPIYFLEGAAITIPTGITVTLRNRIEASPKQQIFKGEGNISLLSDNALGIGEDSKHTYAAWWGIFPIGQTNVIQTTLFNKALSAFNAQQREGIFELDCGSYRIDGTVTIPRGVWFKGAATRRTIIDLVNDGYSALKTLADPDGEAVKITGIQFEQPNDPGFSYFNGTQIELNGNTPYLDDIIVWNPKIGIHIKDEARLATVKNIRGIYGVEPVGGYPADSAMIQIEADSCYLQNIYPARTSYGPKYIVYVNTTTADILNGLIINGVYTTEKSVPIKLLADQQDIRNVSISNINFVADSSMAIDAVIDLETKSGTSSDIKNVAISNVTANGEASYLLKINQASSGHIQGVAISSACSQATGTKAANLIQTAGTLSEIAIGSSVVIQPVNNADPVVRSGTMTNITVPNHLLPVLSIADDAVGQITPYEKGGLLLVKCMGVSGNFPQVTKSGAVLYDVGSSDAIAEVFQGGADFNVLAAGTVPNGTTGTDTETSVSAVDTGIIYIENRTGDAAEYKFAYL